MGATSTAKAAETTRVTQKAEDQALYEREHAPRAPAEVMLFGTAARSDPRTPPKDMSRVLRRLDAGQRAAFLLQCQRRYGNTYVQRVASGRAVTHPAPLQRGTNARERPAARLDRSEAPAGLDDREVSNAPSLPIHTRESASAGAPVIRRDVLSDLGDAISDVAGDAAGKVSDVTGDAVDAVSDVASDAVDAVSGVINGVIGKLVAAVDAVVGQITGAWNSLKTSVTSAVDTAIQGATAFIGGIGSLFGAVASAISAVDGDALGQAWASITGTADSALKGVRTIVAGVTGAVDGYWGGLKRTAETLMSGIRSQADGLINRLPGPAQGPARSLWQPIATRMEGAWRSIESGWTSFRDLALKQVSGIVLKVEGVVTSIKNSVVTTIVDTLKQLKGIFNFIKQAIADPGALVQPVVQEITNRLQGLPDKAKSDAQAGVQGQSASGPGTTAMPAATAGAPAAAGGLIQRSHAPSIQRDPAPAGQPRSTLGFGRVLSGCWDFITDKLAGLWAKLGQTITEMVLSMVWPPATWAGLKQDWNEMTTALSTRAKRIEGIRTDSWDGFWEDLRRWLSNIADFPLIVWRAVNAMLGRLSVYIGLAIILGGAIAGAIAAGTGGAIFGSVVPAAGTAAGGGMGIMAGAWAGAVAGYGVAETVGLVLLVSFVAGEQVSISKALNDLLWVPQSEDEQKEDFNQATDSVIAVATAALLMLIAFIGVALAKRVWGLVRNIQGRFRPTPVDVDPAAPKPVDPSAPKPDVDPAAPKSKIVTEGPTKDGKGTIKVLEDGRVIVCRSCEDLRIKYSDELNAKTEDGTTLTDDAKRLNEKVNEVDGIKDPKEKQAAIETVEDELAKKRQARRAGETVEVKMQELKKLRETTSGAIDRIDPQPPKGSKSTVTEAEVKLTEGRKELRDAQRAAADSKAAGKADAAELEAKAAELERRLNELDKAIGKAKSEHRDMQPEWEAAEKEALDIEGDAGLQDPALIDGARDRLDNVRTRAEIAEKQVRDAMAEPPAPKEIDINGQKLKSSYGPEAEKWLADHPTYVDKFNRAMEKGTVAPKGQSGIVPSELGPPYKYKLKILGEGGNYRIHGRVEGDRIIWDKVMDHD